MSPKTVSTCVHCGRRIVLVNYLLGPSWQHQPEGASFQDRQYQFCRLTIAEPVSGNDTLGADTLGADTLGADTLGADTPEATD